MSTPCATSLGGALLAPRITDGQVRDFPLGDSFRKQLPLFTIVADVISRCDHHDLLQYHKAYICSAYMCSGKVVPGQKYSQMVTLFQLDPEHLVTSIYSMAHGAVTETFPVASRYRYIPNTLGRKSFR